MNLSKFALAMLLLATSPLAAAKTVVMDVNGLVCAFCAQGIQKSMKAFPATAGVYVSLEHRIVAVQLKDGQDIADADLRKAITNAGYTLVKLRRTEQTLDQVKADVGRTPGTPVKDPHDHGDGHG